MTKISVAMATYNGEPFIRQQLESLVRQTLLPTELIVCDDGSSDSTLNIIDDFSRSAPFPVKVINNATRLGFTANFFQAARKCQGDLIAFSDQDDDWLPTKLNRVLQVSRESDALLIAHADEFIDKDGNSMGVIYPLGHAYRKQLLENDFCGHAIVIRRSLLEMTSHSLTASNYKNMAGDVEIGHDALLIEVADAMNKLLFIPEVLVRFRVYSETKHAWTRVFPRPANSLAGWLFPPDLAQGYASKSLMSRRRSKLLSCILRDLATYGGGDAAVASARLAKSMRLITKQADVWDLRARFYGTASRKVRIKLMLEGAAMGQYRRKKQGGVGIHNSLRDMLAVLLG